MEVTKRDSPENDESRGVDLRDGTTPDAQDQGLWQSDCVPDDGVQAGALGSEAMEGIERSEARRRRNRRRRVRGRSEKRGRLSRNVIHNAPDNTRHKKGASNPSAFGGILRRTRVRPIQRV